jgi:hypothetical protein
VVAFAVTLASYVGTHLSNEAVSVLTGAACGVGAMLPAAIIGLVSLLRRREPQAPISPPTMQPGASPYPPVIFVTPQALPNGAPSNTWQGMFQPGSGAPTSERQFSVIGEEEGVWNYERRNR